MNTSNLFLSPLPSRANRAAGTARPYASAGLRYSGPIGSWPVPGDAGPSGRLKRRDKSLFALRLSPNGHQAKKDKANGNDPANPFQRMLLMKRLLNRLMAAIYPECEACRAQREKSALRRARSRASEEALLARPGGFFAMLRPDHHHGEALLESSQTPPTQPSAQEQIASPLNLAAASKAPRRLSFWYLPWL